MVGTDSRALTRLAISATLHCLTGCAIGEVLGVVLGTWWGWADGSTIALGAADTRSIFTMEIVDNAVLLVIPGALDAGLSKALFWGSLAVSLAMASVVTVPVNRWLIARRKGHAVVHAFQQ